MSNLDPLNNFDTADWEAQNAQKMTPDALTPPWQAQGFDSQAAYNNTFGYKPSSIYSAPNYVGYDNSTSAINRAVAGGSTSSVSYTDWSMMNPDQQTATGAGEALAAEFGLQGLNPKIIDWVLKDGISDANVLFQNIYASPEFKAEYPEIQQRQAKGLTPLSPQQIIDARAGYAQALQSVGIDPSFLSKDQMSKMIVNDVSPTEVQNRLQNTVTQIQNDPTIAPQLQQLYGQGVSPGELAAYYLDPDHTEAYLTKQVTAAQEAARGVSTGYGQINRAQAEDIAGQGITAAQATTGFNQLASQKELFGGLPGQSEANITQDQQLGAAFDQNAEDQRLITQRQRQRLAAFSGGGGYTQPGQNGVPGGAGVAQ